MGHSRLNACEKQLQNPNPSIYDEQLFEIAKGSCSYSIATQMISETISAISSMLIIYIILKSPTRLSSTYHRIMLGISTSDLFLSISMALTTLPMPAPGDYWTDIINIQGTRLGNTQTCTAQGFFATVGFFSFFIYDSISLPLFYLCSIGFKVTMETIENYVEPFIHFISITIPLFVTVPLLFQGAYNVGTEFLSCAPSPKPWFCKNKNNGGIECIRGGSMNATFLNLQTFIFTFFFASFIWRILCMGIICWKVYRTEKRDALLIAEYCSEFTTTGQSTTYFRSVSRRTRMQRFGNVSLLAGRKQDRLIRHEGGQIITMEELIQNGADHYKETKIILFQAMWYILSSIFVQLNLMIALSDVLPESQVLCKTVLLALTGLEGFYNLLIFVFHKVFSMQRSDENLSFLEAMKVIINGEAQDSFVITSMKMVSQQSTANTNNNDDDPEFLDEDNDDISDGLVASCASERTPLFSNKDPPPLSTRFLHEISNNIDTCGVSGIVGSSVIASSKNSIESSFSYLDDTLSDSYTQQNHEEEEISFSSLLRHQRNYENQNEHHNNST
jgi:hypothetical protein